METSHNKMKTSHNTTQLAQHNEISHFLCVVAIFFGATERMSCIMDQTFIASYAKATCPTWLHVLSNNLLMIKTRLMEVKQI